MRSPSGPFTWLLRKEWREGMASRSWWVMLLLIGPLVGMAFISAVRTYGELSGVNGTVAGVGEAFSPLIGIWAPTSAPASSRQRSCCRSSRSVWCRAIVRAAR